MKMQMSMVKTPIRVDRTIPSTIKGKTQFICGGSLFTVDDRYQFIKQLGAGAYGIVCSAFDK